MSRAAFLRRIAAAAAKHAPAELSEPAAPAEVVDPHPEPPPVQGRRRRKKEDVPPDEDLCPKWVMDLAQGKVPWPEQGRPIDAPDWPEDVAPLVERINAGGLALEDLPPAPFKLQPWVTISRAATWLEGFRAEVAAGTLGPRARTGALQEDLRYLALRLRGDATPEELEAARNGPSYG